MYWDRFDIVEAHYWFAVDYHGGQFSDLYERMCRISNYYRPGICHRGYDSLSENAQMIYDDLVSKYEQEEQYRKELYNKMFQ